MQFHKKMTTVCLFVCLFVAQGDEQGDDTTARKGFQVSYCLCWSTSLHVLHLSHVQFVGGGFFFSV